MYAAAFVLVDPTKYRQLRELEQAIVCRVYAAVQGDYTDIAPLKTLRQKARLVDANIIALTHFKTRWATIKSQSSELAGVFEYYYCSRCGTPFRDNDRCRKCRIIFGNADRVRSHEAPGIPGKVLAYFEQKLKHQFLSKAPGT